MFWHASGRDYSKNGMPETLVVLTRNAPTTYYEGPDGLMGFEYDLVNAFGDHIGVKLEFKVLDSISDILKAISQGQGDFAAAGLTRTEDRENRFLFGPDYFTVQQQVVCRRDAPGLDEIKDLLNVNLTIIADSSYSERLKEIKETLPGLKWNVTSEMGTEQLLEMVADKQIDCTIADSNIVAINRRYYPKLDIAFPISEQQHLAWILPKNKKRLQKKIKAWFKTFEASGELAALKDKYYGHAEMFDFVDTVTYHRRIDHRLPKIEDIFKQAAQKYNHSWTLLAAMAYQESHWNVKALSPTGVRGIMMLTRKTASALGIDNRLDPYKSIMGGARYLKKLIKRVPDSVNPDDKIKFALAAYNVGMGHIHDARRLARELGKDPDSWQSVKEVLPLLSRKKYYKHLKHGYARGSEPVRYVENILNYKDILENIHTDLSV